MNPRDFCRMPGYSSALALTYNFDPSFFERVILHDLWIGGVSEIVVLADARQLIETMPRFVGQLRHLGRSYCLAAAGPTTCHPKIILRLGRQGAALWIGSGNLTQAGWGGNRELATSFALDANDPVAVAVSTAILNAARASCLNPSVIHNLDQIGRQPWLADRTGDPVTSPLILTSDQESLAVQLQRRWAGRRFTTLRLMTGSTDKDGAFIEWCGQVFGVERCVVAVNPLTASFRPASLDRLAVHTTIAPNPNPPQLHAKFYWFEGTDGPAAVVGSANCSRAAWLMPLHSRGNLEAIMVYDQPSPAKFSSILARLPESGVSATSIVGWGTNATAEEGPIPDAGDLRLLELSVAADHVSALVNRPLPADAEVILETGNFLVSLSPSDTNLMRWDAPLLSEDRGLTDFGRLVVRSSSGSIETCWHWIDNKEALLRSSRRKALGFIPRSFDQFASKQEKDQLLADITLVTKTLITDSVLFADPIRPKRRASGASAPPEPIQPGQLLRELAEIETTNPYHRLANAHSAGLSLHGVLEALFGQLEDDDAEVASEPELDVESEAEPPPRDVSPLGHKQTKVEPVTDRQRKRLLRIMETFQDNLLKPEFVETCTATQLVQAAAYPLLIAALGRRSGWLSNDESRKLLLSTADALFRTPIKGCEGLGLIDATRNRFASRQGLEVFDEVVADGALWVAIVGAIAGIQWEFGTEFIERAIVLREVLSRADLLKSANTERLGALAVRLRVAEDAECVIAKSALADRLLSELESLLKEKLPELMENQRGRYHEVGDPAWKSGQWGTVRERALVQKGEKVSVYWRWHGETVKMAADGIFLNVRLVAAYSQQVRDTLGGLAEVWADAPLKPSAAKAHE
jgi:HKD family nuclease